ncbi:hypothetical protein B1R32_13118 [Abditibacterium utsteinense]|uniref:Uncharacterized protein n=1 Tax=Abditibacterium utsteinense TaxID=1960156 RepID=A0A2S8SNX9_9BACT|nr:hypothetical protein [Abditibacterium utsteinense]PQV62505.1 hypothetical protein B1R32_13118 [Abditibacterium utsteinense]
MPSNVSPKPPRWRWAVLGLLVMGALSVPTGIVVLQHRLQAQPHDTARPWDDPVISKKLADARLAKAKSIRAEWRGWALQHKTELAAMLVSRGKDFSTLQAVYKISPPLRFGDWQPNTKSGPAKFGWYVDTEKQIANGEIVKWGDERSKNLFESSKGHMNQKLKEEFANKSDFQIAQSDNAGPTTTYIWASGRVTEKTVIQNPDHRSGQSSMLELPHKDLVPPFDFLTSANSG